LADALPPQPESPADFPSPPAHAAGEYARAHGMWQTEDAAPPLAPPQRDRVWLHVLLFLITFAATTMVGASFYASFLSDLGYRRINVQTSRLLLGGLWYSVPALLILGSHEMGHYFACRYYRISATLPFFIPAPIVSLFGTLGAVIRIREPLRTKRILFDVGVAGPIAGFVVLLPALIVGIMWSKVMRQPPPSPGGVELGEPMLFQLVTRMFFGRVPDGYTLNAHPMAFASIFGLLATALNLLPIGQLDGGHLAYANLGARAKYVTYATLGATLVLGLTISTSWLIWGAIILVLLRLSGFEHPPTVDEREPLDRGRIAVTVLAIIIFALCFTPWPITPQDLISR
jgi:membrane-associated protease RseP (regulator of RpoE activity)